MKTFSVHFIDAQDGLMNHKLIDAPNIECACKHMHSLGHEITTIEERPTTPKSVTLSEETLTKLTILVNEIDHEESLFDEETNEGGNYDAVVEDLYKVLDIVRTLVS